jgi:tellurite resistance protein TerC
VQPWVIFAAVAAAALFIDQLLFHGRTKPISFRRALVETVCWIAVSLAFAAWVCSSLGSRAGAEFLTAYVVEKSLSLDNIFVFLLIFHAFRIPDESQPKALYGGIAGALLLRALFVIVGIKLLALFRAFAYILGAFLLLVAIKMLISGGRLVHPERNWMIRMARQLFPVTPRHETRAFFLRQDGRWNATPLFLALMAIEAMDIVFAADSIPAVLAITRSTFLAYSSNVFAVLGLRALYFAVAALLPRFRFLHQGIAAILLFVGLKMAFGERIPVSALTSLAVICGILAIAIVTSFVAPRKTPGGPAQ